MGRKTQYLFNVIQSYTIAKLWNLMVLRFSYFVSNLFNKSIVRGLPTAVSIEPTTSCNLKCPECPSGLRQFTRPTGNMEIEDFRVILVQIKKHISYINFYFQGEPFINKDLLTMIAEARKSNIFTSTSTNAHFITDAVAKQVVESGLNRLIISIDGATQEVYEQYRKEGNLELVLLGASAIVKWKKELKSATPYLVFQFLVVAPNEHQIERIKEIALEVGVDEIVFKTAQINDYKNGNILIPNNKKYSRYIQQKNGEWKLNNKMRNSCWRMWSSCVITWDSDVVPCCFDKDGTHQMGNLKKEDLPAIWHNEKYQKFRSQILKNRKEIAICTNCTEGTKVWE